MSVEDSEDMRCDRDGYFDLESLKPYSSVWVSTRRDARSKTHQQDDDNDPKKNVMPSRACNNLHSLLETNESRPNTGHSKEDTRLHAQQLSSTKSDHFPLSPYKLFEKADSVSLRKISDRIIESMCKSDSSGIYNDAESTCSVLKRLVATTEAKSKEKHLHDFVLSQDQDVQEDRHKIELSEDDVEEETNPKTYKKSLKKKDCETPKEKSGKDVSRTSHLGGGEPQEEIANKCQLLSENGKLVTEISLAALNLKDQEGREYPVTVKYIWETNINDILNACDNTFCSSPRFLEMVESVSAVGIKSESAVQEENDNIWQEKSKSQSSCSQSKNKRTDGWSEDDKEEECYHNLQGSKGDASSMRKGNFKDAQSTKNSLYRNKVSFVGPYHEKKLYENINESGREMKMTERENSKIFMSDRKTLIARKNRMPVKKKFSTVEEMKGTSMLARPATFNKRELVPRPAPNRPPSAPTREITSRIPQRINVHENDRLQAFNKRPFGSKFQTPTTTPATNKFWK